MKDLTVVILAGGKGSRMWPLNTDKILFPFLSEPLSHFTVEQSIPTQAARIVIVTNKDNDKYFSSHTFPVPHTTTVLEEALGMAHALLSVEKQVGDSRLLILIADDLCDATLPQKIVDLAEKDNFFGVIPGLHVSSYFPGGYLRLDGEKIVEIVEKPSEGTEPSSYVNISGHYISESLPLFKKLHELHTKKDDVYEMALSDLMKEHEFHAFIHEGSFVSLKYPWHVLTIMDQLLSTLPSYRGENVVIKDNVIIEGNVHIGNNVKIFENTKIVGPCFIGENTIIGNNNVIRHSIIGQNCVTGFNTDITRSYIGDACWFHSNYIGDSILEGNVSMGSGSVLANLRLDEGVIFSEVKNERINTRRNKLGAIISRNVRIGVNTSTMPGIKIGNGTSIGAGITIAQDIPDASFVVGKTELLISQNKKNIGNDREEFKNKL